MAVIETEGLTKLYGSARGIEDVTFSAVVLVLTVLLTCLGSVVAVVFTAVGAWLFERRDLAG